MRSQLPTSRTAIIMRIPSIQQRFDSAPIHELLLDLPQSLARSPRLQRCVVVGPVVKIRLIYGRIRRGCHFASVWSLVYH